MISEGKRCAINIILDCITDDEDRKGVVPVIRISLAKPTWHGWALLNLKCDCLELAKLTIVVTCSLKIGAPKLVISPAPQIPARMRLRNDRF